MLKEKLMEQLNNSNHYTIPRYLLFYVKELGLDLNSLILLIYFLNQKKNIIFNFKKIKEELNFNDTEIFDSITILKDKKILTIEMVKNESGILEETVNISSFYEIIFSKFLEEEKENKEDKNLFDEFERGFGRTLSPIEYDIINNWIEQKIPKELILEALKETVYNGVNNLRYVDKMLFEWNKKGIKKASDIKSINKKEVEEKEEPEEPYYEYDWLNE